jgi:hypothetical protein
MSFRASKNLSALVFTGIMLVLGTGIACPADELRPTPDQFEKLRVIIKPQAGEDKWAEIPWMASLWEGRQRAATLGKPILLWEMDGNPLGCG